jgi:hypothetical protein
MTQINIYFFYKFFSETDDSANLYGINPGLGDDYGEKVCPPLPLSAEKVRRRPRHGAIPVPCVGRMHWNATLLRTVDSVLSTRI